jgi:hypothetical protein
MWTFNPTPPLHDRMRVKYPMITVRFTLTNAKISILVLKAQILEDMWGLKV